MTKRRKKAKASLWPRLGLCGLAVLLLASAMAQDPADPLEDVFTARPLTATAAPAGGAGGGFAAAAEAAGFKPLDPEQARDLGDFKPANPLPAGVRFVGFAELGGFTYESDFEPWTDPFIPPKKRLKPKREVPAAIRALDGKRVAVAGFMLPFDFQREGTRHFALLKSQAGCCFGQPPGLNEWVDVKLEKPARAFMDQPILVTGTLRVKPILEAGNTLGLYSLKADKVEPLELAKN